MNATTPTISSTLASFQAAEQHLAGQIHAAADAVASVGTVSLPDALGRFQAECVAACQRLEQARQSITAGLTGVLARMTALADDLTVPETPALPMTPALEETPTAATPAIATVEEKQKPTQTQTDAQPEQPGVDPEPAVMATARTPSAESQAGQSVPNVEPMEAVQTAANDAIGTEAPGTLATASQPKEVPTPDGGGKVAGRARRRSRR